MVEFKKMGKGIFIPRQWIVPQVFTAKFKLRIVHSCFNDWYVQDVPRNAANARERTRMRVLSKAFGRLKLTLPWVPADTKVYLCLT